MLKKGTKTDTSYGNWTDIFRSIPQGLILDPLLFNIFINNMVFVKKGLLMNITSQKFVNSKMITRIHVKKSTPN